MPTTETPTVHHGAAERTSTLKVACSSCNLRELCLPLGLTGHELERLDKLVATRRNVRRGDTLFRAGEPFQSLYAVRTGLVAP